MNFFLVFIILALTQNTYFVYLPTLARGYIPAPWCRLYFNVFIMIIIIIDNIVHLSEADMQACADLELQDDFLQVPHHLNILFQLLVLQCCQHSLKIHCTSEKWPTSVTLISVAVVAF